MGGGKETPRQKMVGLMYLVLMALLAMNVSKSVLNSFIIIDTGLSKTNDAFSQKNAATYNAFDKAAMADKRAEKWKTRAHAVQAAANIAYDHITALKDQVIAHTDGVPIEVAQDYHNMDEDGKVGLWRAQQKDNYDKPTHFLIGDPENPSQEEWSAHVLSETIRTYRAALCEALKKPDGKLDTHHLHLDTHDLDTDEVNDAGVTETWALKNFDHLPLVAVVTNLTKMQSDIRNREADVIKRLYSHIGADDFKFDTLAVKVIPNTNYVILGDSYKAEVIVAAFSTAIEPKLLASKDFNDSTGVLNGEPDTASISIENGVARYQMKPTSEGPVTWGGRIGILKPGKTDKAAEESYAWYPFSETFVAAKPSLVVSPTAMNVFYRGIQNPVEVSVPGIAPERLTVTFSNTKSKKGSVQKGFEVNPGKGKEVIVSVSADMGGGKKQNFGKKIFRVKNVPSPVAMFASSKGGNVKLTKLRASQGVAAKMENFEFDLKFRIVSYIVSTTSKGKVVDVAVKGNKLNAQAKAIFKAAKGGQKIYIEKIKAKGPDGSVRDLSSIAIKAI